MPNTPINFTNLPKFKYGTTARINSTSNTPISNGSILIDIEAGKIYMDQNGERLHLNDIITVTDYSSLPASPENKIYRLNDTGDLYWPKNVSGSVTWINLCEKNESVTIDTVLNASSNNAIANSTVTAALNGKADSSHTHSQSQITGLTTALSEKASASELAGVASRVSDLEANAGDMKKSIYDTDNDGVVERADVADSANSVAWNNVSGKPSTFTPSSHTHTSSAITDLNSAIATATSSKMDTPSGGSAGQVLTKTASGYAWANVTSSGEGSSASCVRTISSEDEFESLAEEVKDSLKEIAFLATPGTVEPTNWSAQNGYVFPGHAYLLLPFRFEHSYEVQWKHFVVTERHWKCTLKGGSCEVNGVLKTLSPGKGEEAYSTGTYGTSWDATKPSDTQILRVTIDTKPLYISDTEKIIVGTNGEVDSNGNLILVGDHYELMSGDWGYTGKSVMKIKCDYSIEYYTSGYWKDSTTVTVDRRDYYLYDLTAFNTYYATPTLTTSESLEIAPGGRYEWTLNSNSTLNAVAVPERCWAIAHIDIAPGAHTVTAGNNLTIVGELTADVVNICEARWRNGSARLKVVDVITEGSGGGTTEGTITASSQTITGTAGTSLSYNLANYVTVSNGQTPTFTLASGQVLPTGLSLSNSGVISGTTNVTGTTTIRVKVSASNCPDVEMTVTFNIAESTPQGTITVTTDPDPVTIQGVVGTAIVPYNLSSVVTVSNGMTPSFSWLEEYVTKPSWLTITETGVLSGTPSSIPSPNAGKVTVSADNCNNAYIDITWDIINAGTITIDNQTIDGTVGNAVSLNLSSSTTVSNGQTPTFTVKSGNTLPAGIELSSAGVLSGTPTATSSATVVVTITARGCPDKEVNITFNITEAGGETPSDGWPTKIVVSNATSSSGDDVSAFNGDYVRTGETLTILGEKVPIWSNGSKYIYGIPNDAGTPMSEPAIALFDSTGNDDTFFCYYYRMKSGASTSWTMGTGNSIGLTATITEVSGGESGGTKEYVYTVTGATDIRAGANGDYYATGETLNGYPVYTNGEYFMYYFTAMWTGWTIGKNTSGGDIYTTGTTDPIGVWTNGGVVVSAYSGSSSGGETGGGDSFPTTFTVTACDGNGAATGTYAKTANTTTVGGKDYPVYSMTQELLGTTFYIYVCGYQMGSAGTFWALKSGSYSVSDDSYGALGSCAAGTDGLPQSTSWSSASSSATVTW